MTFANNIAFGSCAFPIKENFCMKYQIQMANMMLLMLLLLLSMNKIGTTKLFFQLAAHDSSFC